MNIPTQVFDNAAFWSKVVCDLATGCWLWMGARDPDGYGRVRFEGRVWLAHRVAWTLVYGPISESVKVLHHCDNPPCVNPDTERHLFSGSMADNTHDMMAKGRHRFVALSGEAAPWSKLNADDVRAIRARYALGDVLQRELAVEYDVTRALIGFIVRREIWKEVE